MHIMSTNFAKTLVWKHEYDVKLWHHKERTPNTNDYHMPLNENPHENFLRTPLSALMHSRWSWNCLFLSYKKEFKRTRWMCWKYCQLCKIHWKIKLLREVFDSRFSGFSEEDRMLAFINPFSLNITF